MRCYRRTGFFALLGMLLFVVSVVGNPGKGIAAEFGYSGDLGPGFWGSLSDEWIACGADTRQSPINIKDVEFDPELKPLDLHLEATKINLINNGHTIEQEYEAGSTVNFGGREYGLSQFHFHTLSEHTVRGKHGVMELHAVFSHEASGDLLVIGQLYRLGEEDAFLAQFDDILPKMSGDRVSSEAIINLADGLTDTKSYYTYAGSLTTPPCSPIVTWIVLKTQATMSKAQFHAFRHILGNNFRPLQALNEREIRATSDDPEDSGK